jgi:hypothetical protein
MAKWANDNIMDSALNYVKNNVTRLCVCSAQPTTFAEATSTYKLAMKTGLTTSDFTGPADGDASGRKLTVNAQSGLTVDTSGTATHVALTSESVLLYVTTCTNQSLTAGNQVNVNAWDIEIADPT